jgi:signal transduction histidine kinase
MASEFGTLSGSSFLADDSLNRSERTIAAGRVMLAVAAISITLLSPHEPLLSPTALYVALGSYIAYSIGLLWWFTNRADGSGTTSLPILAADIAWSTVIVGVGEGSSSPFFLFYFFALCSAAIGFGLRTTLRVAVSSAVLYIAVVLLVRRFTMGPEFYVHSAHLMRPIYLILLGYLVGVIGEHELSSKRRLIEMISMQQEADRTRATSFALARLFRRIFRFFDADYALLQLRPSNAPALDWEGTRSKQGRIPVLRAVPPGSWTHVSESALSYRVSHALGNWGRTVESFHPDGTWPSSLSEAEEPGFLARSRSRSLISVPLSSQEGTRGLLMLGRSHSNFSEDDLMFCRTLVAQATVVIDNIILQTKAEDLAVAEERARIARDVHDGFVQSLASIDVGIEVCRQTGRRKPEHLAEELASLQQTVKQGYREARRYLELLRDQTPRGPAISIATRDLIREFRERTDLEIQLQTDVIELEATHGLGFEVLQIVREALTNITRHSGADNASVRLVATDHYIEVTVFDNGHGFPAAKAADGMEELPLAAAPWSIRERVETLGGELRLRSGVGQGAEITVRLPTS